jgi:hypothetical protein
LALEEDEISFYGLGLAQQYRSRGVGHGGYPLKPYLQNRRIMLKIIYGHNF